MHVGGLVSGGGCCWLELSGARVLLLLSLAALPPTSRLGPAFAVSSVSLVSSFSVVRWFATGPTRGVGKLRKKRKRHVSYRLLKKEITNWTIRSSKTARVCFSCRFVGARRFKRNFRERKRSKQFCWWMPHFYKHRGYPLKCLSPKLFGKGFSYKDALGPSNDFNSVWL